MIEPASGDVLLVVDVQHDFLEGGALGIARGSGVIAPLNRALDAFQARGLPVIATRDWHPPGHCSFRERGGPWPVHCVQGTHGADFHPTLRLPPGAVVVSKGTDPAREAYSGFEGTPLADMLRSATLRDFTRVFLEFLRYVNATRPLCPRRLNDWHYFAKLKLAVKKKHPL